MSDSYLRVEGVNLTSFVEDTQDLSTIRGGSLLLLEAIELIKEISGLEAITTGASAGLFRFTDSDLAKVLGRVKAILQSGGREHATFVVEIISTEEEGPDKFKHVREELIAWNRYRQMHQPSLSFPHWNKDPGVTGACSKDKVRPADSTLPGYCGLSTSVAIRREHGVNQKQKFYMQQLGDLTDIKRSIALGMEFVNDLDELTGEFPVERLNHKMAVIYLDGNKFTEIQDNLIKTSKNPEQAQKEIDAKLQSYRREVLRALLQEMKSQPMHWKTPMGKWRIETLLWGGDDITWVVPAWKGWATLTFFYQHAKVWTLGSNEQVKLKHAAGLVFCHHKADIHRMTKLAKELAELAKKKDRGQNLFAYQVLESFDNVGMDLVQYRSRRCLADRIDELILNGEGIQDAPAHFRILRRTFPKRRLFTLLSAFQKDAESGKTLASELEESLDDDAKQALKGLKACLGDNLTFWFHLADLWDYFDPEPDRASLTGGQSDAA